MPWLASSRTISNPFEREKLLAKGVPTRLYFEIGEQWTGDDIIADLEDFKRDASRASVHQVKKMYMLAQGAMDLSYVRDMR